jgi:hypothetical protein
MGVFRSIFYMIKVIGKLYRWSFRWLSGRPMDGQRRTDSTFLRPATRSLDPSGTALRWEMLPGIARAGVRLGLSYLLLLLLISLLLLPVSRLFSVPWYLQPENLLLLHLISFGIISGSIVTHRGNVEHGWKIPYLARETVLRETEETEEVPALEVEEKRWVIRWWEKEGRLDWEKEKVLPVAQALTTMLNAGTMTRSKAREMVRIPRDFRSPGRKIIIHLPKEFTGADANTQKRIISTVRSRLGIREEISASWELEGSDPLVSLSMPPAPPAFVSYSDMLPYLQAAEEYKPAIGIVAGGEVLSISLTGDSPHIAVSAGSGAGKSYLIRALAVHFARWGWNIVVLDWKEESQEWAKGLPGVRYCTSIEQIHDMCVALGEEVEARKANPETPRPKTLVISEEMNITAPLLAEYWATLRATADPEERRTMPLRSPAMTGIMMVNYTGRSLGFCQVFVAQRFSARVTNGNADLRESFQVMFMARWKPQTLKMLAGGIKPFPKMPKDPGRWVVVIGDQAAVLQVPFIEDHEAREYAMSGEIPAHSPFILRGRPTAPHGGDVDLTLDGSLGDRLTAPHRPEIGAPKKELRKLKNMVDALAHLGITHDILKHASKDSKSNFPPVEGGTPHGGYLYDLYAVSEWAKKRNATRAAERKIKS